MKNQDSRIVCVSQKAKKRILIISEGKKTEPNYFNAIKRQYRLTSVDIADTKKNTGKELLQIAIDLKAKAKRERNSYDEIWIALDRDGYTKHAEVFDRVKKYPEIRIGFSSPCFEYWLLLHFEYTSAPFDDCDYTIKKLETYLPDYQKGKDYSRIFMERISTAVSNSKKIKKHQEDTSDVKIWAYNPYSNLHELIEQLLNLGK
jgi:RloB-like protein